MKLTSQRQNHSVTVPALENVPTPDDLSSFDSDTDDLCDTEQEERTKTHLSQKFVSEA